jgi:hypothetical protein
MNGLGKGYSHILTDDEYYNYSYLNRPETERYYGEVVGFEPSESNSLSIDMKYTVFGCRFDVEGLNEGYITIELEGAKPLLIEYPNTWESAIITFSNVASAFATPDSYSEDILTTIKWYKSEDDNEPITIASESLNYARLKRTKVTISLVDEIEKGISITQTENNSSITDGDSHTITKNY